MRKGSVLLVIAGALGLCAWLILSASPRVVARLGGTDPDSAAAIKVLAALFTFVGALLLFGFIATWTRRRRHRRRRRY